MNMDKLLLDDGYHAALLAEFGDDPAVEGKSHGVTIERDGATGRVRPSNKEIGRLA
jgi:hypothetical protein